MRDIRTLPPYLLLGALVMRVASAGCSWDTRVYVTAIELGTAVDADGSVTVPTRTFGPQSVVFASIRTDGVGPTTLHVLWVDANHTLVQNENRAIDSRGPARFVFRAAPPNGWPRGKNRCAFWLDGEESHAAEFEVQ